MRWIAWFATIGLALPQTQAPFRSGVELVEVAVSSGTRMGARSGISGKPAAGNVNR